MDKNPHNAVSFILFYVVFLIMRNRIPSRKFIYCHILFVGVFIPNLPFR